MPPSNIQGLNVVHPVQDSADSHNLLLGQAYPDLTSQLDLWTNLPFELEEPLASRNDEHKKRSSVEDEDEESRSANPGEKTTQDGHVNGGNESNVGQGTHYQTPIPGNLFDINSFLAGFSVDAFTGHASQPQHPNTIAPSLAQLLALHSAQNPSFSTGPPQYAPPAPPSYSRTNPDTGEEPQAPVKRARTRKQSVASSESPTYREDSMPPSTLSPGEDKRRRNTAASARFRMKKKEREAALENRAKELETKVTGLERECEGLRRENGWLKGLVVGVTGAVQAPNPVPPPAPVSAGTKRSREEST